MMWFVFHNNWYKPLETIYHNDLIRKRGKQEEQVLGLSEQAGHFIYA